MDRWDLTPVLGLIAAAPSPRRRPEGRHRPAQHPLRHRLLGVMAAHPGLSLAELARRARIARNTAAHHVYVLEQAGLVRSVRSGRGRHYFLKALGVKDRHAIALLREGRHRDVAQAVRARPGLKQADLAQRVGAARKVLRLHLDRLVAHGLVREERQAQRRLYWPTEALERALARLRRDA